MKSNYLDTLLSDKNYFDIEMLKLLIKSIPANVFFKDNNCRYQMVNYICDELNQGGDEWTILGKTDFEVQNDPQLAEFYYQDDKKIIATQQGSHFISEVKFGGERHYYEITKEPVIDVEGNVLGIIGIVKDITECKKRQEEFRVISITDRLTGLYNRNYYEQKIIDLSQTNYSSLSIIMCDTNGLKFLNDNFGHHIGDELLKKTASIMKKIIGDSGEIARIGGDEFICFCIDCSESQCIKMINKIKETEKNTKSLFFPISNAYGYVTISGKDKDLKAAISKAEKSMYRNKKIEKVDYLRKLSRLLD
ncbi:sensor domain-containing diguanylate cyclase [Acetobacterium woodii]|uniref:Response regulator-like protein n=1 Tax=Acetobacterium woodii (strain ATCC 29683 / DSM 1030 / JCM 2381 / KCTC 1655 / WB1) TaxID=931626 RepID=H6LF91_ACEWD|nr:GGDEF domain-containing protein [Acetobacterium woodii]AFA48191.1 response regulator-like protein [Acetobacterium woodii DSM 1030]